MARQHRINLTESMREVIFAKTGGHCHFCGDALDFKKRGRRHGPNSGAWDADHVVQVARGGKDCVENCLPVCSECNALRWFRNGPDVRRLMFLGLVARDEVDKGSPVGQKIEALATKRREANVAKAEAARKKSAADAAKRAAERAAAKSKPEDPNS